MSNTSALSRKENIQKLTTTLYDLLVIGGGITGAGIALDAASRGLSVALIEQEDFASGTSSKSTKLIHGGLRYLKQFEVALVREVGQERAIVHKLAPHLVIPEKMLLPFTKGGTFGYWTTSAALKVYDMLAGVSGDDKRVMLSKSETEQEEPLLRKDILLGSGLYAEYRTDDARLTIENIKLASQHGALALNYIRAEEIAYDDQGKTVSINCLDRDTNTPISIKAKQFINAAGPWVDELRKKDQSLEGKRLFLSKGVHIVVPHKKIPVKHSLYIDTPDGRMIFIIPRLTVTYIGTTDTEYKGDKNRVLTNKKDVQYLLDAVNAMLPSCGLKEKDVVSSWAGLRPLIYEEGKSASEISRKDEIFESKSGLLSIAGGKLTGYRKMSEKIVDLVAERISESESRTFKECYTDKLFLAGGPFSDSQEVVLYVEKISTRIKQLGLAEYFAAYLVYNYGQQSELILDNLSKYKSGNIEVDLARAELDFGIKNELVITAEDFFNRRTGRLYFNIDTIPTVLDAIIEDLSDYFEWNVEKKINQKNIILERIKELSSFE